MGRADERGAVQVIVLLILSAVAALLVPTACTTRLEEAKARQAEAQVAIEAEKTKRLLAEERLRLEAQVAIEQERTDQLRVEREIVEEKRLKAEAEVELEEVRGQNLIRKAVAEDITRQSRMYAVLQAVLPILAIISLIGAGLFATWFFAGPTGPYGKVHGGKSQWANCSKWSSRF